MRYFISIISLLLFSNSFLLSQNETANKIYDKYGFKVSIPEYQSLGDLSLDELAKVANAYRLNHETENAEIWYSQVVEKRNYPIDFVYCCDADLQGARSEDGLVSKRYHVYTYSSTRQDALIRMPSSA